jgi:hypothetical protein
MFALVMLRFWQARRETIADLALIMKPSSQIDDASCCCRQQCCRYLFTISLSDSLHDIPFVAEIIVVIGS